MRSEEEAAAKQLTNLNYPFNFNPYAELKLNSSVSPHTLP